MSVGALILVEPSLAGNIGAAMRVAANFGVQRLELVRPGSDPEGDEVRRWACGAPALVEVRSWASFDAAAAHYRSVVASASGRGRPNVRVLDPRDAVPMMASRGLETTALVFGNETRGLTRDQLDRCDAVVRVPTDPAFPVLNLAQAVAIVTAACAIHAAHGSTNEPEPARQAAVEELMEHLQTSLLAIGFLDPANPQRILRKLRRLFGRAGITDEEVRILRGMCRQMEWAAGADPERCDGPAADHRTEG